MQEEDGDHRAREDTTAGRPGGLPHRLIARLHQASAASDTSRMLLTRSRQLRTAATGFFIRFM